MKKRLLIAVLLGALGFAAMVVLYRHGPGEGRLLPPCVFREVTGFHCIGCGITRACHALLHLRFWEAFGQNPLLVVALPLVLAGVALEGTAWVMADRYRGPRVRLPAWAYRALLVTLLAYWVLRNVPVWPFSLLAPH